MQVHLELCMLPACGPNCALLLTTIAVLLAMCHRISKMLTSYHRAIAFESCISYRNLNEALQNRAWQTNSPSYSGHPRPRTPVVQPPLQPPPTQNLKAWGRGAGVAPLPAAFCSSFFVIILLRSLLTCGPLSLGRHVEQLLRRQA